jgi:hypothetical protein
MADLKNKMCMKYPDTDQLRIENDVNRFIEWLLDKKVLIRG